MNTKELCTKYVAFLRMLYMLHQNNHWSTKGLNFYGQHLLFERLYESAQENADLAAEKFLGVFGAETLGLSQQTRMIAALLEKYFKGNPVESSLQAEEDFLKLSQTIFDHLKSSGDITLGVDDMLMSIASDREESVYLLKQCIGEEMNKLSALADKFKIKLAQVADRAAPKPIDPNAGPKSGEEAQLRIDAAHLVDVGNDVMKDLAEVLKVSPDGLSFAELRFVNSEGKKAIKWVMKVSPTIAKQFQANVAKFRVGSPAFNVPTYVSQLFTQKMPGVPVLPAQPLLVG